MDNLKKLSQVVLALCFLLGNNMYCPDSNGGSVLPAAEPVVVPEAVTPPQVLET